MCKQLKFWIHFKVQNLFTACVFWELFHYKYFIHGSPQMINDLNSSLGNWKSSASLSNIIYGLVNRTLISSIIICPISNELLQIDLKTSIYSCYWPVVYAGSTFSITMSPILQFHFCCSFTICNTSFLHQDQNTLTRCYKLCYCFSQYISFLLLYLLYLK